MGYTGAQRMRPGRLPFVAEVRAIELNSGREVWGETTNLSKGGCHVRTPQTFSQGTLLQIEIRNHRECFVTDAKVAYTCEPDRMGLSFLNIPASQLPVLDHWLSSASGELPLEPSRRSAL